MISDFFREDFHTHTLRGAGQYDYWFKVSTLIDS
jgi:hypothetical protein